MNIRTVATIWFNRFFIQKQNAIIGRLFFLNRKDYFFTYLRVFTFVQ